MDNVITRVEQFKNELFSSLTTIIREDGSVWFIGSEVTKSLGYKNISTALKRHCTDSELVQLSDYQAGSETGGLDNEELIKLLNFSAAVRSRTIIPESDLYKLVMGSTLDTAKKFQSWVTKEVLPAIRKTGGYIPSNEEDSDATIMAKALMIASKTIEEVKRQVIVNERTIETLTTTVKRKDEIIEELNDLLCLNIEIPELQRRLNTYIRGAVDKYGKLDGLSMADKSAFYQKTWRRVYTLMYHDQSINVRQRHKNAIDRREIKKTTSKLEYILRHKDKFTKSAMVSSISKAINELKKLNN